MVLAAGYGTRLRPLTASCPKPLVPVANRPLLALTLRWLERFAPAQVVVNGHYLAEQVAAFLRASSSPLSLRFSRENKLLGTGGGIRKAAPWLASGDFFVTVNSDLVTDIDLEPVIAAHRASGALATLVMHDCPRFNKVWVRGGRVVSFRPSPAGKTPGRRLAYTGIQVCAPRLLPLLAAGDSGSVSLIEVYEQLLATGREELAVYVPAPGSFYWRDLGTAADYLGVHRDLASRPDLAAGLLGGRFLPPWVAPTATLAPGAAVRGGAAVGAGCHLDAGSEVVDSVLWPGVRLGPGSRVRRTVLGPGVCLESGRHVEGRVLAGGREEILAAVEVCDCSRA